MQRSTRKGLVGFFWCVKEASFDTTTGETSSSVLYHDYSYQQIRISLSQHQPKVSVSLPRALAPGRRRLRGFGSNQFFLRDKSGWENAVGLLSPAPSPLCPTQPSESPGSIRGKDPSVLVLRPGWQGSEGKRKKKDPLTFFWGFFSFLFLKRVQLLRQEVSGGE